MEVRNSRVGDNRFVQERVAFTCVGAAAVRATGVQPQFVPKVLERASFDTEIGAAKNAARRKIRELLVRVCKRVRLTERSEVALEPHADRHRETAVSRLD